MNNYEDFGYECQEEYEDADYSHKEDEIKLERIEEEMNNEKIK